MKCGEVIDHLGTVCFSRRTVLRGARKCVAVGRNAEQRGIFVHRLL